MKRLLATVGFLGALTGVATAAKSADVLYVGKFDGKGIAQDEASTIEASACTAASADKRFVVKCRDTQKSIMDLREAQAQMGFAEGADSQDNCGKEGCMGALSKGTEAKWVLAGSVAKVAERQYLLTLIVVDPASNVQLNRIEEKVSGEIGSVVDKVPAAVRRALTPQAAAPAPAQPAPKK